MRKGSASHAGLTFNQSVVLDVHRTPDVPAQTRLHSFIALRLLRHVLAIYAVNICTKLQYIKSKPTENSGEARTAPFHVFTLGPHVQNGKALLCCKIHLLG